MIKCLVSFSSGRRNSPAWSDSTCSYIDSARKKNKNVLSLYCVFSSNCSFMNHAVSNNLIKHSIHLDKTRLALVKPLGGYGVKPLWLQETRHLSPFQEQLKPQLQISAVFTYKQTKHLFHEISCTWGINLSNCYANFNKIKYWQNCISLFKNVYIDFRTVMALSKKLVEGFVVAKQVLVGGLRLLIQSRSYYIPNTRSSF